LLLFLLTYNGKKIGVCDPHCQITFNWRYVLGLGRLGSQSDLNSRKLLDLYSVENVGADSRKKRNRDKYSLVIHINSLCGSRESSKSMRTRLHIIVG
jgi:hypothetical protein